MHLTQSFFARPAEVVAPELIGCLLLKRQADGELLWGMIVETEAYSQDDPACHGYRRRSPSNETLFGEPGRWYVYVSYGIHHRGTRGDLLGPGNAARGAKGGNNEAAGPQSLLRRSLWTRGSVARDPPPGWSAWGSDGR